MRSHVTLIHPLGRALAAVRPGWGRWQRPSSNTLYFRFERGPKRPKSLNKPPLRDQSHFKKKNFTIWPPLCKTQIVKFFFRDFFPRREIFFLPGKKIFGQNLSKKHKKNKIGQKKNGQKFFWSGPKYIFFEPDPILDDWQKFTLRFAPPGNLKREVFVLLKC